MVALLLLGEEGGARVMKVPCLMTMEEYESCVLIIHGLSPMKVSHLENYLIRQAFADVYFSTDSAIGINARFPPGGVCCQEVSKGVSDSLKD